MDRARVAVLVAGVVTAAASVAAIVAAATSSDSDNGGASVGDGDHDGCGAARRWPSRSATSPSGPTLPPSPPGTQVVWTNNDAVTHSIRSADGSFDSPDIGQGETFTAVFTTPGTYEYVCGIHDTMHGTIIVEG